MKKTATIQARVHPKLKKQSELLLKKFGLSPSEYINMALSQMVIEKRIPFSAHIPNNKTITAIHKDTSEATGYSSVEKLMDDISPQGG
ncbi:MAG: type II toxin-antitoxin system RelB/DinJ family antitoxin [Patescibacteria group bacterium]